MVDARRLAAVCLILSLLGFAAGCRSIEERRLRPESEISGLATLGDRCDDLEQEARRVPALGTRDGTLELAFQDYREEEGEHVIVAIHGILSCHATWRYLIGALDGEVEFWTLDMPGCGASDAPPPRDLHEEAYSPYWMALRILSALEVRLKERPDVSRVTILCHSLGGGVVLRMLGSQALKEEYPHVFAKFDRAILLAPLDFGLGKPDKKFKELATYPDLLMTLGDLTRFLKKASAETTYYGAVNPKRIPRECFERLYLVLQDTERRHAMQAMLRNALPLGDEDKIDMKRVKPLVDAYADIDIPCLILWGEMDGTLPHTCGYHLYTAIPDARLRVFRECMHSIHIEDPHQAAGLVRDFLSDPLTEEEFPRFAKVGPKDWPKPKDPPKAGKKEVTATGDDRSATKAPSTIRIVTGDDVVRSGARYPSDALRLIPGLELQRLSSTESAVAIRGYVDTSAASQGVLGLVDGRQVYNQFLGNVLWDQLAIRLEDIEQIEVVLGPASFLHGPNAMHGVVHIRTKSPLKYSKEGARSVTAHTGTDGSVVVGTTLVNRTANTGFRVSAEYDDIDQFDDDRENTRDKAFFEAVYEVMVDGNPDHVLSLAGGYSHQNFDILLPELRNVATGATIVPATTTASESQEMFARLTWELGDPRNGRVEARVSWSGMDAKTAPTDYYQPFTLDLDTMDADAILKWENDIHALTGGAGGRYTTFSTSDRDVSEGSHSIAQFWLYAQDVIAVTPRLSFTVGARMDWHTETDISVAPRGAAVWEFVDDHILRASAGRGFRLPSLRETWFDMQTTVGVTVAGNDDLDPECLTSYELSYFGTWGSWFGLVDLGGGRKRSLETGVTGFYNIIDDLISYEQVGATPVLAPRNQSDELAYGVELEGKYWFNRALSVRATYAYSVREDRDTGKRNLIAPQHKVTGGVNWSVGRFEMMVWANYYGSSEMAGEPLDSYMQINGSVSYTLDLLSGAQGRAFLRFWNLFDDAHREHPDGDEIGQILTAGLQFDW